MFALSGLPSGMKHFIQGQVIKIKEFDGLVSERIVWEVLADRVLICDAENYQLKVGGKPSLPSVAFPFKDVSELQTV